MLIFIIKLVRGHMERMRAKWGRMERQETTSKCKQGGQAIIMDTSSLTSTGAMGWRSFANSRPKGTQRRFWGSQRHSCLHDKSLGKIVKTRLEWTNIIEPGCRSSSSQISRYSNQGNGRLKQRWKKPARKLFKQPEQGRYMEESWPASSTICSERELLKNRSKTRPQEGTSTITVTFQKSRTNSSPDPPRRRTWRTTSFLGNEDKLCSPPLLISSTRIQHRSLKKIKLTKASKSWQKSPCISKSITNRRSCRKLSKILKK